MGSSKHQLCWGCKNATGGCSWADNLKPVEGWDAKPTIIRNYSLGVLREERSYKINGCPKFIPEGQLGKPTGETGAEIAKRLGISERTYFRHKANGTLNKLENKLKARRNDEVHSK